MSGPLAKDPASLDCSPGMAESPRTTGVRETRQTYPGRVVGNRPGWVVYPIPAALRKAAFWAVPSDRGRTANPEISQLPLAGSQFSQLKGGRVGL